MNKQLTPYKRFNNSDGHKSSSAKLQYTCRCPVWQGAERFA